MTLMKSEREVEEEEGETLLFPWKFSIINALLFLIFLIGMRILPSHTSGLQKSHLNQRDMQFSFRQQKITRQLREINTELIRDQIDGHRASIQIRHDHHHKAKRRHHHNANVSLTQDYQYSDANNTNRLPLVVGSMTTTPWRLEEINGDLGLTLITLLSFKRLDKIYINIPLKYGLRSQSLNVSIPDKLHEMVNSSAGRLIIHRSIDYGPSTKLLPLLLLPDSDLQPDTIIITFDDDRIYREEAVEALYREAISKPGMVITIAAWNIGILSSNGRRGQPGGPNFHSHIPPIKQGIQYVKPGLVDIICGFFGVAYRKHFFSQPFQADLFNYSTNAAFQEHCMFVDDIWFSGHLERLKIPRYVIGNVPNTKADPSSLSNSKALSLDKGESVKQNFDNVHCANAMRRAYGIWDSVAPKKHSI